MNGKRTERTDMPQQLRLDERLAADIRLIAGLRRRPIRLQILHWIERGVESDLVKLRQVSLTPRSAAVRKSQEALTGRAS